MMPKRFFSQKNASCIGFLCPHRWIKRLTKDFSIFFKCGPGQWNEPGISVAFSLISHHSSTDHCAGLRTQDFCSSSSLFSYCDPGTLSAQNVSDLTNMLYIEILSMKMYMIKQTCSLLKIWQWVWMMFMYFYQRVKSFHFWDGKNFWGRFFEATSFLIAPQRGYLQDKACIYR
jgi:hypothetical protein